MQPAPHLTLSIRALSHLNDLKQCEEIQRAVWGFSDLEIMAAPHLSAVIHAGGLVAGAFYEDAYKSALCGFVFGFPAYARSSPGLHSDMMAVLPKFRGLGIGQQLKWFQRDWCLQRGLSYVSWTFDPLQAKNAKLNLEHLGASASEYLINPYGVLGDTLNGALPSDRLVAHWDLSQPVSQSMSQPGVRALEPGTPHPSSAHACALHAETLTPNLIDEPHLLVATPEDINALRATDPDRALAWRLAQREVFLKLFARGYTVTRFVNGHYMLER